ncbi:MAG: alpha-L-rhamnosidase C-terminal domain-containing protein [Janthinobacterium lividum]
MFGEIGAWLYKGIAGIKPDENNAGFKNTILEPHFVAGLDHFEASHKSQYGTISSAWQKKRKKIFYEVIIPANSTATVILPVLNGMKTFQNRKRITENTISLPSGKYNFKWK